MENISHKHAAFVRWTHWLNVPLLFLMIWSGILIYWANDVYRIGYGDFTLFKFFPKRFYDAFSIGGRLAEGMALHFACMWALFINGTVYVIYTFVSGDWRDLLPNRSSFKEAYAVVLHDLRLSKKPLPVQKFNGAQRIAYTSVVAMGILSVLSGIALYKPIQVSWLVAVFGGYETTRLVHFYLTIGYLLFFIIHIAQVVKAGWNNARAMITGYELTPAQNTHSESSDEH